jgi:hypothetical protein
MSVTLQLNVELSDEQFQQVVRALVPREAQEPPQGQLAGVPSKADPESLTEEEVRAAYSGGTSEYWRPFIVLLARQSQAADDGWVKWSQLHDALGLTGLQGAGMLGAAERRCAGKVPYQKAFEEGEHWFRMPPRLADQVLALAAEGR